MSTLRVTLFVCLLSSLPVFAQATHVFEHQSIVPNTTLTAETTNNTSAANSFPGCEITTVTNGQCVDNGDLKASNISKVDVHNLLSPSQQGAKIYTTYIPYWVHGTHPNIGYSSQDPNQVTREITDLTSRGFDGVIVDWYGPGSYEEGATEVLKTQMEQQSTLSFALMIDQGAIEWFSCYPSCSATQAVLNLIAFARQKGYFSSPAAIRNSNGKTIVTQFGMENYNINWTTIENNNTDLEWIFENAGAFSNGYTIGAYGWLSPKDPLQPGLRRAGLHAILLADRQPAPIQEELGFHLEGFQRYRGQLGASGRTSHPAIVRQDVAGFLGGCARLYRQAGCRAGRDLARL